MAKDYRACSGRTSENEQIKIGEEKDVNAKACRENNRNT